MPKRKLEGYYIYGENGMTWVDDNPGKQRPADESWTQDEVDALRGELDRIWNGGESASRDE